MGHLPTSITVSFEDLKNAGYIIEPDENDIEEILSDYITDKYEFLHGGFTYQSNANGFNIEDIRWDYGDDETDDEHIPVHCNIDKVGIDKTLKVLIDNGIEEDEAKTVLQAIGYTLINTELEPLLNGEME